MHHLEAPGCCYRCVSLVVETDEEAQVRVKRDDGRIYNARISSITAPKLYKKHLDRSFVHSNREQL